MAKGKMSFFERLTGTIQVDHDDDSEEELPVRKVRRSSRKEEDEAYESPSTWDNDPHDESLPFEEEEGQLSVDVYQTPSDIYIQTMVAGVRPDDLDVSITREMVTIKGKRHGPRTIASEDYFYQELYWGTFSRSIVLPQEIEVEEAEATESHGLLIIKLPKVDKARSTRLKIKSQ